MRIELPPPPRKIYLVTGLVLLFVAGTNVITLLWHRHPVPTSEFRQLLFDVAILGLFGIFNVGMYASRSSVEVAPDRFKVIHHIRGFGFTRTYRMTEISHLRFTPYPNDRRRGVLSFDCKGRTRWLPMVEPDKGADALLAQVHAQFPNLSVRQKTLNIR